MFFNAKQIRNNHLRDCIKLGNNSTAAIWESNDRNYWLTIYSEDLIFNVVSISFIDDEKGVLGCFNSKKVIVVKKNF